MITMRIGTWNVEHGKGSDKNASRLDRILAEDADVWVLTETHDDIRLPEPYQPVHSEPRPGSRTGGRWVSIWTRIPVVATPSTDDPHRTVAAELEGRVLVYGTVLPWHSDPGPEGGATNWSEFRRVLPQQAQEWCRSRDEHPGHLRIVAGDVNQSLGHEHHYGTKADRRLLEDCLQAADLQLVTAGVQAAAGLVHPPIDHIAVGAPSGATLEVSELAGFEGAWDEPGRLSDHSAVLATVTARRHA